MATDFTLVIAMVLTFIVNTNGNMIKLKENSKFVEIQCIQLSEPFCTHSAVNNWCKWNNNLSLCENNYEPVLFISTWDVAVMPKSVISSLILFFCMIIYWLSGVIMNKLKIFKAIEPDKRNKCQIYVFELIGVPLALSYLLYEGTFGIVFKPDNYTDLNPNETVDLVRSMSTSTFLIYMYAIEMLTNKLRWSLQLHHLSVIVTSLWFMVLLDGDADIASLRCILAISLYPMTESNVFAQLLLYRISPSKLWQLHLISAVIYLLSRIFILVVFTVCYISWANTDAIYDQFHDKNKRDGVYIGFFILIPMATILLNIAQFQTVKALFYMTKSVLKQNTQNKKYLKELHDIFVKYDRLANGYWTDNDWQIFITQTVQFNKQEIYTLLWDIFLFDPQNMIGIQNNKNILYWNTFRKIFQPQIINKKFENQSIQKIVIAQLQLLLKILSNTTKENKHSQTLQMYAYIHSLMDTKQYDLELIQQQEIEELIDPIHSTLQAIPAEMAISISMVQVENTMKQFSHTEIEMENIKKNISTSKSKKYANINYNKNVPAAISISVADMKKLTSDTQQQTYGDQLTPFGNENETNIKIDIIDTQANKSTSVSISDEDLEIVTDIINEIDKDEEKQQLKSEGKNRLHQIEEEKDDEHSNKSENKDEKHLSNLGVAEQIIIPALSVPIWYNNVSMVGSKDVDIDENILQNNNTDNLLIWKTILFYGLLLPISVTGLILGIYIGTSNAFHCISWFATFASMCFVLFYIKTLLFSKNICFIEMKYKCMNGCNYIPNGVNKDYGRSFDSVSMMSHIRGSTIHKYHTFFVNLGSISVLFGSIIKLFDMNDNNNMQEKIGIYMLLCAGIGGVVHGNIEVYSSPSYSIKYNLTLGYIHLFGVFLYIVFGVISFLLYTNMNLISLILCGCSVLFLIVYKCNAYYQWNKHTKQNEKNINYIMLTNKRSKINMSMELLAIIPSVIAMCTIIYEFGNE
eukprot:249432_1